MITADDKILRDEIKRYEGFSLKPYKCPKWKDTIGWGWNFEDNRLPEDINVYLHQHGEITVKMAEELLDIAIKRAIVDVKLLVGPEFDKFSDNRQRALIDMSYQHGYTRLSKYAPTIAYMKKQQWDVVAIRLRKTSWYKQSGRRSREIVKILRLG